jgi:anti-anti-sigma regulatory factor
MQTLMKTRRLVVVELGREYATTDRVRLQNLSRKLLALLDEKRLGTVMIDLGRTEEFGAGLLSVLIRAFRHAERQGHEVIFCGVHGMGAEIFSISKLDQAWHVFRSRAEAMEELGFERANRVVAA